MTLNSHSNLLNELNVGATCRADQWSQNGNNKKLQFLKMTT